MRIHLKVIPKASKESIEAFNGGLKVWVRAPADKSKANDAVIDLLANRLGIPPTSINIVSGHTSERKLISIDGLTPEALMRQLGLSP